MVYAAIRYLTFAINDKRRTKSETRAWRRTHAR